MVLFLEVCLKNSKFIAGTVFGFHHLGLIVRIQKSKLVTNRVGRNKTSYEQLNHGGHQQYQSIQQEPGWDESLLIN